MQYTEIFLALKFEKFQLKMFDFFLIFAQNIDCGYTLEPPRRGGSNEYPQSMFWSKNKKNIKIFPVKIFIFTAKNNFCIMHGQVFVMYMGTPIARAEKQFLRR